MDTLVRTHLVDRTADILSVDVGLAPTDIHAPIPVPTQVLDAATWGLVIISGDSLPQPQIESFTEDLSTWFKSPTRPESWKSISVLYVFSQACPPGMSDVLARQTRSNFFTGYHLQTGYYDVASGQGKLPSQGSESPILDALKQYLTLERLAMPSEVFAASLAEERERLSQALEIVAKGTPWGTWLVASVCVLMFGWTCAAAGNAGAALQGKNESIPTIIRLGGNYAPYVLEGQWWRLWASTFLHFGIIHLALNMQGLLTVGPTLERLLGSRAYLALYALAGLSGSLASTAYHAHRPVVAAGASGAIFGVFGAVAFTVWSRRDEFPPALRKRLSGGMVPCIGYNLLIGLSGAVDNAAHIGGLVGGVVVAAIFATPVGKRETSSSVLLLIGLLPFANQVYAGVHAMRHASLSHSPVSLYRDPQGQFSIKHPDEMRPEAANVPELQGVRLSGDGVLVLVILAPAAPGEDLKAAADSVQAEVKDAVERREPRQMRGAEWLLTYGTLTGKEKQKVCTAVGKIGDRWVLVRVMAVDQRFDEAVKILPGLVESIEIPAPSS